MANINPRKTPMLEQDPLVRDHNFEEVTLGYTNEMAMEEARHCLQYKHKPCISGCLINIRIPEFTRCITEENLEQAYHIITSTSFLSAVCGRVRPQETQCEARCVRSTRHEPVGIGHLERYVTGRYMNSREGKPIKTGQSGYKVAVIGVDPIGLTYAGDLDAVDYSVTVFEALHTADGVLIYGIPQFRLPKEIVQKEINLLKSNGVIIKADVVAGKVLSVDELFEIGPGATFISSGAGLPSFMNTPDEGSVGVYSTSEFLIHISLMKTYKEDYDTLIIRPKNVAVRDGGNVTMDAARSAKRLGVESVYTVYRRAEEQTSARREEIHRVKEERIDSRLLTNPVATHSDEDNRVTEIERIRMELGEPDTSGCRRLAEIEGSNLRLSIDCVAMVVGSSPNPLLRRAAEGLETSRRGCLIVNEETLQTTREGVFAGGDAVTGAAAAILAMGEDKHVVSSTDEYTESKK